MQVLEAHLDIMEVKVYQAHQAHRVHQGHRAVLLAHQGCRDKVESQDSQVHQGILVYLD